MGWCMFYCYMYLGSMGFPVVGGFSLPKYTRIFSTVRSNSPPCSVVFAHAYTRKKRGRPNAVPVFGRSAPSYQTRFSRACTGNKPWRRLYDKRCGRRRFRRGRPKADWNSSQFRARKRRHLRPRMGRCIQTRTSTVEGNWCT